MPCQMTEMHCKENNVLCHRKIQICDVDSKHGVPILFIGNGHI